MTLREKIIELMRFHCINERTQRDEHPFIDVFIFLKHDSCFGDDVIHFDIKNGIPSITNRGLPSVYGDIYDQEVVGEDKREQDGDYINIRLDIDPEYLEAKAKELGDTLPDIDVLIPELREKVWAAVHNNPIYKEATQAEVEYINKKISDVLEEEYLNKGAPSNILRDFNMFILFMNEAIDGFHQQFLTLGKTNYELIKEMNLGQLSKFLVYDLPKDINDDYSMTLYLNQVHD